MTPAALHDGNGEQDLGRFFSDLRRSGTVVDGPVAQDPVEWLVTAHRGTPADPPYRLALDEREFTSALERDARVIQQWWPDGDARARAYAALLVSFDAALVGIDRTPHGFVLEREDHLHLTTSHLCPDPLPHLGPAAEGTYGWYAYESGTPEFAEEMAEQRRRSRHRRHSYLVLGWLEVEAATEDGHRMDAAVGYLQDQMVEAFGRDVFQRFSDHLEASGSPSTAGLVEAMHEQDERFDDFLDALAGEPGHR